MGGEGSVETMGFNSKVNTLVGKNTRSFVFKDGVRFKNMMGKSPIVFRLLPAFDPGNSDPATSTLPCIDSEGNFTDWANIVTMARFVGRGRFRADIVSPRTADSDAYCPLEELYQAIRADEEWKYMIDGESRCYGRPSQYMVANVVLPDQAMDGAQIGVFSYGAMMRLIGDDGLIKSPSAAPNIEELAKQNYLYRYANGDVTDPVYGPLMVCVKGDDKGEFSAYKVIMSQDRNRQIMRMPVDGTILSGRYDLRDINSIVNVPDANEAIEALVHRINGVSPTGIHEHALLRRVFPQHQIPEPPSAPGRMSTVTSGFSPSPAAESQSVQEIPDEIKAAADLAQEALAGLRSGPVTVPTSMPAGAVGGPGAVQTPQANKSQPDAPPAPAIPGPTVPGDAVPKYDHRSFMEQVRNRVNQG